MQRIRAAVCHEFGKPLQIEEVLLRAPGPGEIEVAIQACAICHSDISYAEGAWGGPLPAVYGHEAVGRVSALGPGIDDIAPGDTVLVTLLRACGGCPSCTAGAPAYCQAPPPPDGGPLRTADGGPLEQGLLTGAFAEKVVVARSQVAPVPDDMPPEAACLLSCGVATGMGAVINTAGVRPGQVVVVIGAGGVGLNAIQGARIAGAARIVAVDLSREKLAAARDFGATDGVLATEPKPWKAAREAAGRGADAVFVSVGAVAAYDTAPRYLAPRGRLFMLGMPHSGACATYEPVILAALGQGMIGTRMGDVVLARDIPWMVDLWRQGRLKLEELVSERWSLERINDAIADTRSGAARRNVILP